VVADSSKSQFFQPPKKSRCGAYDTKMPQNLHFRKCTSQDLLFSISACIVTPTGSGPMVHQLHSSVKNRCARNVCTKSLRQMRTKTLAASARVRLALRTSAELKQAEFKRSPLGSYSQKREKHEVGPRRPGIHPALVNRVDLVSAATKSQKIGLLPLSGTASQG